VERGTVPARVASKANVNKTLALALAATLVLGGCGKAASPGGGPPTATGAGGSAGPGVSVAPSGSSPVSTTTTTTAAVWRLRYALLDHYPNFAFCDPDLYPVARADEQAAADAWWASANHGSPEVQAILAHAGLHEPLSATQRLTAYGDHKKLAAIAMTQVAGGYDYQLSTSTSGTEPNQTVAGVIGLDGAIRETSRQARPGGCPICLEAATRIATPGGDVAVALIRPGDMVWTTDAYGRRVAAPVEQTISRETPGPHLMLWLALSDGRTLVAAGAHPSADGTFLRQLHIGDPYDGATIVSMDWVTSTAPTTFDLLPAGATGTYWANGIMVGSTLKLSSLRK
jgi:hypothetical protein